MNEELIKKIITYNYNEFGNEFGDTIVDLKNEVERLTKEVEKYKKRCYEALKLIRENYGLLDKYGIDMIDDILNGK